MLTKVLGAPSGDGGASSGAAGQQQQHQPTPHSLSPIPAAVLGPLGDRAVASGALCSYLAYLCAVHGVVRYGAALPEPAMPYPAVRDAAAVHRHTAPLDVLRLLRVSEERGAVLHVVPCVTSYLDYLAQGTKLAAAGSGGDGADGEGSGSGNAAATGVTGPADAAVVDPGYCRAVARQLRRMLSSRVLQPSEPYFCTAGLCLRSALEDALGYVAAMAGPEVLQVDEEEGAEEGGGACCRSSGPGAATGGRGTPQSGVAAAVASEEEAEGAGEGGGAAAGEAKGPHHTKTRKGLQPWEQLLAASLQVRARCRGVTGFGCRMQTPCLLLGDSHGLRRGFVRHPLSPSSSCKVPVLCGFGGFTLQDSDGLIDSRFLEHCCPGGCAVFSALQPLCRVPPLGGLDGLAHVLPPLLCIHHRYLPHMLLDTFLSRTGIVPRSPGGGLPRPPARSSSRCRPTHHQRRRRRRAGVPGCPGPWRRNQRRRRWATGGPSARAPGAAGARAGPGWGQRHRRCSPHP